MKKIDKSLFIERFEIINLFKCQNNHYKTYLLEISQNLTKIIIKQK